MIRTGYLRWEIDVADEPLIRGSSGPRSDLPGKAELPRDSGQSSGHLDAAEQFTQGETTYDTVLRAMRRDGEETDVVIPDVGPGRSVTRRATGWKLPGFGCSTSTRGQRVRPRSRPGRRRVSPRW